MVPNPLLLYIRRFKWLFVVCGSVVVLVTMLLCAHFLRQPKLQRVAGLAQPVVALNFDPNDTELEPEGGWLYNIATGELQNVGRIPKRVCDFDAVRNTLLGIHEGMVAEVDIQDGVPVFMGAAEYKGSELVPHTLQYRPQSRDYSALTKDGVLVLWEQETAAYRELAQFGWYQSAFAYSWLEDGKTICVPDSDGIAVLDTDTLAQRHWLTVNISYSDGGPLPPSCKRPFAVSPRGNLLVFCGSKKTDKMMIATIEDGGKLGSKKPLTDERDDGQCWFDFSPDGKSVIYGVIKIKNALFNPNYYEIWLYREGEHIKLMEREKITNFGIGLYW